MNPAPKRHNITSGQVDRKFLLTISFASTMGLCAFSQTLTYEQIIDVGYCRKDFENFIHSQMTRFLAVRGSCKKKYYLP